VRARPLTTAVETRAEAAQRTGGGGSTWAQIQADNCVTRLRDLAAFVPSDAPSGPERHIVYVAVPVWLPSTSWQNVVLTVSGLPVALLAADTGFDAEGVVVLADLGAIELVADPREGGAVVPDRRRVRSERVPRIGSPLVG
jgi:hypothetical protein